MVSKVPVVWMNDERNFVVQVFKKVEVIRNTSFAGANLSKSIEASAIASQEGEGKIQLSLACDVPVDMYEVATSLCRLLFRGYKVIDALLFMTMLSADLDALQRRGYDGNSSSFLNELYSLHLGSQSNPEKAKGRRGSRCIGPIKWKMKLVYHHLAFCVTQTYNSYNLNSCHRLCYLSPNGEGKFLQVSDI